MTSDELLGAYRAAAIEYGTEIDAKRCNVALARLPGIIGALRAVGAERRILELLDDESEHVRAWAGFDALVLSPDDGVRVLRELAEGPYEGVGAAAEMTLQLWEKGELELHAWQDAP